MNSRVDFRSVLSKVSYAVLSTLAVLALSMILVTPAHANPCCQITAINPLTGVITAKINTSGQLFQFTVANKAQVRLLKIGTGVYANFGSHQISFDGRTIAGRIVATATAPAAPSPGTRPTMTIPPAAAPIQKPAAPLDGAKVSAAAPLDGATLGKTSAAPLDGATVGVNPAAPLDGARVNPAAPIDGLKSGASTTPVNGTNVSAPAAPLDGIRAGTNAAASVQNAQAESNHPDACCDVTGIEVSTGVVTARVKATGQIFQFSANSATVHQLHVGQGVFANFKADRISLDGQHVHGIIIAQGAPPASPAAAPLTQSRNFPTSNTPTQIPNEVSNKQCAAGQYDCCVMGKDGSGCHWTCVKNRDECSLTVRPVQEQSSGSWNVLGAGRGLNEGSGTGSGQVPPEVLQSCAQTCNAQGQAANPPQSCTPDVQTTNNGGYSCSCHCLLSGRMASMPSRRTDASSDRTISNDVNQNNAGNPGWNLQNHASAATSSDVAGSTVIAPDRSRGGTDSAKKMEVNPPAPNRPAAQQFLLPQLTAGTMQFVQNTKSPSATTIRQRRVPNSDLVQLRGINEIAKSTLVSQATSDFLLLHARTLPPGEIDQYAINTQLAQQWFAAHPEPESIKQAAAKARASSHTGCHVISTHCAEEAAKHAEGEAQRQVGKLLKDAQDEWKHITHEATNDWHQSEGCFVDHTLSLPNVPVSFTATPGFPLSIQKSGTTKNGYGSASGSVSGTATFGVPITPDFNVDVEVFYVPCLPFMIRPKSIETNGTLQVGGVFQANINTTGQFQQQFTIPTGGGPHFPIAVLPLALGPVPIAELDLSVYVDGTLAIDGNGSLKGGFNMQAFHKTAFDLICNGHGCNLKSHNIPVPESAAESVQMQGVIHVRPAVYAALQVDFDIDLLTVRAGPEPYLLGEIYGCSSTTASQSTATGNSSHELYALTADLDWGIDLRAEALVGTDKVGENKWDLTKGHILFKDLAQSNALIPSLAGPAQASLNQTALFKVKMPACYPYHDDIEYRAQWGGGATASSPAPPSNGGVASIQPTGLSFAPMQKEVGPSGSNSACTIEAGEADCWENPSNSTALDLTWPSPGNYSVSIVPVRDKHGRVFSAPAAQANIMVQ